jgi:hypothetical protein
MQYQSPIRLFNHLQISTEILNDVLQLPKLKKLLLAELAIAENGIIKIDDFTYDKNEILIELDKPDFYSRLQFHQQIWNQKSLLNLLEKNQFNKYFNQYYLWIDFKNESAFVDFISPYFATSFNHVCKTILDEMDFVTMPEWLSYIGFIKNDDYEIAFGSFRNYLQGRVKIFKNINVDQIKKDSDFTYWASLNWADTINKLPEFLNESIEQFINAGINFTVNNYKKNVVLSLSINKELLRIKHCTANQLELLTQNLEYYKNYRVEKINNTYNLTDRFIFNPIENFAEKMSVRIAKKETGFVFQLVKNIIYFGIIMIVILAIASILIIKDELE